MAVERDNASTGGMLVILGIIVALAIGYFVYQGGMFNDRDAGSNVVATTSSNLDATAPAAGTESNRVERSSERSTSESTTLDLDPSDGNISNTTTRTNSSTETNAE